MKKSRILIYSFGIVALLLTSADALTSTEYERAQRLVAELEYPGYLEILELEKELSDSLGIRHRNPHILLEFDDFRQEYIKYVRELPSVFVNTRIYVFSSTLIAHGRPYIVLTRGNDLWILPRDSLANSDVKNIDVSSSVGIVNELLAAEDPRHYSPDDMLNVVILMYQINTEYEDDGFPRVLYYWTDILNPPVNSFFAYPKGTDSLHQVYRNKYQSKLEELRNTRVAKRREGISRPHARIEDGILKVSLYTRSRSGHVHHNEFRFSDNRISIIKQDFIGTFDLLP